jgi:hypothetical protein
MKWNNIMHTLGALGCIGGIIAMYNNGWLVWQWPAIALLWIITSYINTRSAYRANQETERLHKDLLYNIEQLAKADMRTWEAEMKLAKLKDQTNKK